MDASFPTLARSIGPAGAAVQSTDRGHSEGLWSRTERVFKSSPISNVIIGFGAEEAASMLRPSLAPTRRALLATPLLPGAARAQAPRELLNVSYDPTREFYREYNAAFARSWQASSGQA